MSENDLSVTLLHNGAFEIAAIIDRHRVSRVYYFCTKSEAVAQFIEEFGQG